MSTIQPSTDAPPAGMPLWDPQQQFIWTRRLLRLVILLLVFVWVFLLGWVFFYAPITQLNVTPLPVGANLTIVLAPIIAASTAVERGLETFFNVLEGRWHTLVAYLGRGLRWLKSAETEVQQSRQFLADVSEKYSAELQGIAVNDLTPTQLAASVGSRLGEAGRLMSLAEQRLAAAEANLSTVTSADSYVSAKAAAAIIIGLWLGIVLASIAQLQMFAMLGVGAVPARVDVFITGLIIGSGSNPVHSLIGLLQQGKDALDSVSDYWANKSTTPPAPAVVQPIVQSVEVPAVGDGARG
jgi:hypothetical protein